MKNNLRTSCCGFAVILISISCCWGQVDLAQNEYPFVGIVSNDDVEGCIGILISSFFVVTSARCFEGNSSVKVTFTCPSSICGPGAESETIPSERLIFHEQFVNIGKFTTLNDVLLVKLKSQPKFLSYHAEPAKLVTTGESLLFGSNQGILVGLDRSTETGTKIQKVELLSPDMCRLLYGNMFFPSQEYCSVSLDDKNAPISMTRSILMVKGKVLGLSNFVKQCPLIDPEECAYFQCTVKLSAFTDWIESKVNESIYSKTTLDEPAALVTRSEMDAYVKSINVTIQKLKDEIAQCRTGREQIKKVPGKEAIIENEVTNK